MTVSRAASPPPLRPHFRLVPTKMDGAAVRVSANSDALPFQAGAMDGGHSQGCAKSVASCSQNQFHPAARRRLIQANVPLTCGDASWTLPDVAMRLSMLAPTLAPTQRTVKRRFSPAGLRCQGTLGG
jgi:hypothetical protein